MSNKEKKEKKRKEILKDPYSVKTIYIETTKKDTR